ncbi:DUF3095 domain-containing protein [Seohaeicola saemankumensis]|nr:DUF3095 domain-containing protein [Seohaeicola saemankumensis]MCA0870710.1 DUF3095 domain-containing protein [Seohaeicola saemankumensis]
MAPSVGTGFYDSITPSADFAGLVGRDRFTPLPDDWVIGTADIVDSTGEIARGRYKTVNMVGASVISAMVNAMAGRAFPYVFGGDGASFAVAAADIGQARAALAAIRRWADREFGIEMRAALVPVDQIRAAGHDVRVARFAASAGVDYAMFSGGGLSWAEEQMKSGLHTVDPAPADTLPDLTGLSCRWSNLKPENGIILSMVVVPVPGTPGGAFADVARRVLTLAQGLAREGHPVPQQGPSVRYPPPGLTLEAQATHGRKPLLLRKLELLAGNLLAWMFFRTGVRAGDFDPVHYASMVSANADFRKFDDGLKMTLDCDAATRDRITEVLDTAETRGLVRYGLFEQDEAMVTCFVPSVTTDDHVHFVDGAAGGYTQAAARIKLA